jgi:hypothetical protein
MAATNEWIPIAEAKIDPDLQYWTTWHEFETATFHKGSYVSKHKSRIIAVMLLDTPEPYVPPKPQRGSWQAWMDKERRMHSFHELKTPGAKEIMVCEVLPGDPDPDAVLSVMEDMARFAYPCHLVDHTLLMKWIKQLKGGQ